MGLIVGLHASVHFVVLYWVCILTVSSFESRYRLYVMLWVVGG